MLPPSPVMSVRIMLSSILGWAGAKMSLSNMGRLAMGGGENLVVVAGSVVAAVSVTARRSSISFNASSSSSSSSSPKVNLTVTLSSVLAGKLIWMVVLGAEVMTPPPASTRTTPPSSTTVTSGAARAGSSVTVTALSPATASLCGGEIGENCDSL